VCPIVISIEEVNTQETAPFEHILECALDSEFWFAKQMFSF